MTSKPANMNNASPGSSSQSSVPPEQASRRHAMRLGALWASAAAMSAAGCGGGNTQVAVLPGGGGTGSIPPSPPAAPPPSQAPGATGGLPPAGGSFGVVTALNPLTVADVAWQVPSSAQVLVDDLEESSVQLGMVVRVMGGLDAGSISGVANDVLARPALRGPVSSLSASGFVLNGVQVRLAATAVFAGGLSATQIRDGDVLHIHGHVLPSASGAQTVLATRLRRASGNTALQIASGMVRLGLTQSPSSFSLGTQGFNFANAIFASGQTHQVRDGALVQFSYQVGSGTSANSVAQIVPVLPAMLADSTVRIEGHAYTDPAGTLQLCGITLTLPSSVTRAQVETRLIRASGLYRDSALLANVVALL